MRSLNKIDFHEIRRLFFFFFSSQAKLLFCQWGQPPPLSSSVIKDSFFSQRRPRRHMVSLQYFLHTVTPSLSWSSSWSHPIWSPLQSSSRHSVSVRLLKVSYPFQLRRINFALYWYYSNAHSFHFRVSGGDRQRMQRESAPHHRCQNSQIEIRVPKWVHNYQYHCEHWYFI